MSYGITCSDDQIKITDLKVWQDFVNALNNPSKEVVNNRRMFFEECTKLYFNRDVSGAIHVESPGLDTEQILKVLLGE